jgi:hypothetical protein
VNGADVEIEIVRETLSDRYTMLPNALLRDATLTVRSRGLLAALLSMRSGWRTTRAKINRDICPELGREALNTVLRELREAGYITTWRVNDPSTGRFRWRWEVRMSPAPAPGDGDTGSSKTAGQPMDGLAALGPVDNQETAGQPMDGLPDHGRTVDGLAAHGPTCGNTAKPQVSPSTGKPSPGNPPPIERTSIEKKPTTTTPLAVPDRYRETVDTVRALRPGWLVREILAALEHPDVRERDLDGLGRAQAALILLAEDVDGRAYDHTRSPTRLPFAGPWWADAEARIRPRSSLPQSRSESCQVAGCRGGMVRIDVGDRVAALYCPICRQQQHAAQLERYREASSNLKVDPPRDFDELVAHVRVYPIGAAT